MCVLLLSLPYEASLPASALFPGITGDSTFLFAWLRFPGVATMTPSPGSHKQVWNLLASAEAVSLQGQSRPSYGFPAPLTSTGLSREGIHIPLN